MPFCLLHHLKAKPGPSWRGHAALFLLRKPGLHSRQRDPGLLLAPSISISVVQPHCTGTADSIPDAIQEGLRSNICRFECVHDAVFCKSGNNLWCRLVHVRLAAIDAWPICC